MTTEIKSQIKRLFKSFYPDDIIKIIEEISGGCINRLWRVDTNAASFALKLLNPIYAKNQAVRKNYKVTEKISQMFQEGGFPAVPAIYHNNNPLLDLDNNTFILYPWISGKIIGSADIENDQCFLIGQMTASLHSANLIIDHPVRPQLRLFDENFWQNLIAQGEEQDQFWTDDVMAMLSLFVRFYENGKRGKNRLLEDQVITHKDINLKNIIWLDNTSYKIIDWEAAGYANPMVELLEAAFDLSGQWLGILDREKYEAVIRGYYSSGITTRTDFGTALAGCFACRLEWLEFNLRRMLNWEISEAERKLSEREASITIAAIKMLEMNAAQYHTWYKNCLMRS